jgi:Tol biopolymer transport system component
MKTQGYQPHRLDTLPFLPDKRRPFSIKSAVLLSLSLGLTSLCLNAASLKQVSVDSQGNVGDGSSNNPSISANGRFIVYHSEAGNLVANDTNNASDIFYHDKKTGATYRITLGSQGEGNDDSVDPRISDNGRYVVYSSAATNLVEGDTNVKYDIFLFDSKKGATRRISVSNSGGQSNGGSYIPAISANGRYIVYDSYANNLVAFDHNLSRDIFLYDKKTGKTAMVSVNSGGMPGNDDSSSARISNNGRYVVFHSDAHNLVEGDTNNASDIFLRDIKKGTTRLISVNSSGGQGNGGSYHAHISNNGRYIVYASDASNLVEGDNNNARDIFLYDTKKGTTRIVSNSSLGIQGNSTSDNPRISSRGRYIVYASDANNLVEGDNNNFPDVFRFDKRTGLTYRVSVGENGIEGTGGGSYSPDVSGNGRFVAYESYADTLLEGDTNKNGDIFLTDLKKLR